MNKTSDYFLSNDGKNIFYRHWKIEQPKKIVCIVHGLGEHSGRYEHLAEIFSESSITTFALDLRGHGQSEGKRGHAKNIDDLIADTEELMKIARVIYNDLPMIIFGHSMGGNLVARLVSKKPTKEIAGFALSAPWLQLAFDPPKWKLVLGKYIANIIPSLTQPNGLNTKYLSKDETEIKKYEEDPLVHGQISARLFSEIVKSGKELQKIAGIDIPGFCYYGLSDKIIDSTASHQFATKNNLKWMGYENVYHEPHNDSEKAQVIKHLVEWILTVNKND
jgi:alpha-beta hydrolase superfamily lysophospholipase